MTLPQALKASTKTEHDQLEGALDLLRDDLSLDQYIRLLKRFYGLYKVLEPKLDLPTNRRKVPRLEEDLTFFGQSLHVETPDYLPSIENESDRMGICYVLEGSTLGGQVLTKHFREKFNLTSDQGLSFFSGYGKDTLTMWRSFQDELLIFGQSESFQEESVIASAKAIFSTLERWLNNAN